MHTELQRVYVVTDGCYSDYRIVGIFDNEEAAELLSRRFGYNDVEAYELNPAMQECMSGLNVYQVIMARDGSVHSIKQSRDWISSMTRTLLGYRDGGWHPARNFWGPSYGMLLVECWAKDAAHAIKIANEQRLMMLAGGEWPELPSNR